MPWIEIFSFGGSNHILTLLGSAQYHHRSMPIICVINQLIASCHYKDRHVLSVIISACQTTILLVNLLIAVIRSLDTHTRHYPPRMSISYVINQSIIILLEGQMHNQCHHLSILMNHVINQLILVAINRLHPHLVSLHQRLDQLLKIITIV